MLGLKKYARNIYFRIPSSMILMFHHIGVDEKEQISSCILSRDNFEKVCKSYAGIIKNVDDCLKKNNYISFTFDDGFADLYSIAYPIMKQYKIPFTLFIIEDFIGRPGYMTMDQIKELSSDPLVEIGSHGVSHKNLTTLTEEEIVDEIRGTKKRIENILGKRINKFAYSHGQYNDVCLNYVKVYDTAFAADSKPINIITRRRRYYYPRINMTDTTIKVYKKYLDRLLLK